MKNIWSKFLLLILLFLIVFGCGKAPQMRIKEDKDKTKIAVCSASVISDNYKILKKTMEDKAQKEDLEIIWLDAQNNAFKQDEDIKKAVEEKVKIIVIEPVDPKMLSNTILKAQKEGIKTIFVGSIPPDTGADAFISPDFTRAGEMQGQQMLNNAKLEQAVNILILRGPAGNPRAEEILKGNLNTLNENKKVAQTWIEEVKNWDSSNAYEIVNRYLTGQNIPQVIFTHSPELTMGMLKAVEQYKIKNAAAVQTYGMGTQKQAVEAIKKGMHTAEIDFMPELFAQILIQAIKSISKDEPWEYEQQLANGSNNVPARFTPIRSITKENIDLLKERMSSTEKNNDSEDSSKGDEKSRGENQKKEESEKEGTDTKSQESGGENKKMTVIKIKNKDGQEFQMNVYGDIVSIEMKGEEQKEGEKTGEEGEEGQ